MAAVAVSPNPTSLAPTAPMHTISILVRNKPGVLVRVALVFSRRGYNIESLVVSADVTNGEFSRMTITCSGDPQTLDQIIKQVTKLIDVVHAFDHTGQFVYETEVALVKIQCKLAGAYGIKGWRIRRPAEVDRILKAAMAYDEGPCVVEAEVIKEDNVFPMIPAGAALKDMIIEKPKQKMAKPEGST